MRFRCEIRLIKGGSKLGTETAIDVLYDGETFDLLESEKIDTTNTHGAGCTYSAAITAELAKGKSVKEAVKLLKNLSQLLSVIHSRSTNT